MSQEINLEELKTLIANGIKEQNLNGALPEDAIERIKEKILATKKRESAKEIPGIVSELDMTSSPTSIGAQNPYEDDITSQEQEVNAADSASDNANPAVFVAAGSVPTGVPMEPTMGYTPELPEMLKKAEPSELFVFQYNEVGQSGENLSFKPMRLMSDPDVKKSMSDLWVQEGKTRAKVFVAKFEEMGEIEFNYVDGTSKFTEKASLPDYTAGSSYKENPYMAPALPQIDEPTKKSLETYLKSSVDLTKVVNDIVMGIIKDSLLTNSEKPVQEDIVDYGENRENNGYSVAQSVKPMEESSGLKITMKELVENSDYEKITLPDELNEGIVSGNRSMLINENEYVQEWEFKGKRYFTPVGRISKNKGYTKS